MLKFCTIDKELEKKQEDKNHIINSTPTDKTKLINTYDDIEVISEELHGIAINNPLFLQKSYPLVVLNQNHYDEDDFELICTDVKPACKDELLESYVVI